MGAVSSTVYNFCRRKVLRYNIQNRALKFLDKEKFSPPPRHPINPRIKAKEVIQNVSLKHIHEKNNKLVGFLKKVYLTSKSEVTGTPSKRPLPKKENECRKKTMFYEPETVTPGHVTLTDVLTILIKTQDKNNFLSPNVIAKEYKLDKKDAENLIAYYCLFKLENFEFINAEKPESDKSDLQEPDPIKDLKRIAAK